MRSDVVVVGAGPAGIAAAIAATQTGLHITVLDHRKPPIDKPCGEGLLPGAVRALHGLGVPLDATIAFPFRGIRFSDGQSSATAPIARGPAYGLRRTALHRLLLERAAELHVRFLWGVHATEFHQDYLRAAGERISFRWLIGAEGQNSVVRRWSGLSSGHTVRPRFGFRRHYAVTPRSDCVEVHWGERCQMFVTPTGAAEVCVALLSNNPQERIERALGEFPEVEQRLSKARAITPEAGAVSMLRRSRAVVRGNVALVGDASCAIDGIAGQGLSLAFQQAAALGEALAREDLGHYEAAHAEITNPAVRMTRLLLLLNSSVPLRRKTLRFFAENPKFFAKMVSLHTRENEVDKLKTHEIADLSWRILWA
jgi:menaquinone-9 beta-reductase